jgi:hypothetical protein
MKRKYVLCPGYVRSKHDGDLHFVGADKLTHLYGISRGECYVLRESDGLLRDREIERFRRIEGLIWLYPMYNGDYSLPEKTI